jgi:hypothetical protein
MRILPLLTLLLTQLAPATAGSKTPSGPPQAIPAVVSTIKPDFGMMCDHTAIARHDVAYATYLATTYADEFDAWIASGSSGKAPKKHNWVATYSCCTYATMPAAEAPLGVWFPTREACSNKCGCGDFYNPVRQRERVRGRR